jgi:hypothetical protein
MRVDSGSSLPTPGPQNTGLELRSSVWPASTAPSPCSAAIGSHEAADAHPKSASTFESRRPTEMLHGGRLANVLLADPTSPLRQARAQGWRAQAANSKPGTCKGRDALRATLRPAPSPLYRSGVSRRAWRHLFARRGAAPWPTTACTGRAGPGLQHQARRSLPQRTRSLPRESAEHWASAARARPSRAPRPRPADKRVCPSTKRPRQLQALVGWPLGPYPPPTGRKASTTRSHVQ